MLPIIGIIITKNKKVKIKPKTNTKLLYTIFLLIIICVTD